MTKQWIRADNGKVTKVLEFENGRCVEIPINKDGSIKWMEEKAKQQISKIGK